MLRSACAGCLLLLASAGLLAGQTLVLDQPLNGTTSGTRIGGSFVGGGWKVTGHTDSIYWHIPTLTAGAVEWDISGLNLNEGRAGMQDKAEIFHMYDFTFGNSDVSYNGGYRDNPYKHFVRKIGTLGGTTNAMELVWQILPNFHEPDTPVLSWNPSTTYRIREEWGPDGAGNSVLRTYRDGTLLRTTSVPGTWAPAGHSVRIAASPRAAIAPDGGAPIDAVFSNLKVWNLSITEPPPPLPAPRTGAVSLNGHALHDDQGDFNGLGASYFQALRRTKFDRTRFRSDLDFLARRDIKYIRALSMVGWYDAWQGKEIAPITFQNQNGQTVQAWSDYEQQLRDMIDIAYDEFGIRTELTIFADAQLMPNKADRIAHMNKVLAAVAGREEKVILLEVANEAWQNGFPGAQGVADLREFGQYLGQRTDTLVALSATPEQTNASLQNMYQGSAADIATEHFSRDIGTVEGGWLPVRDVYRVNSVSGIPPVSSNEPVGPGSSVASENDPIKLVSAAAYAWMSGLPMYVYHSRAGVFGDVRFEDMAGAGSYRHLDDILPGDIANWSQRSEGFDSSTPFITYANGQPNKAWTEVSNPTSGVLRHLSNVRDGQFYTLPIAIRAGGVELEPRQDMTIQVFNPLSGEVAYEMTPSAGQRFTLAQGPQAYIIRGSYDDGGPARINLDRVNDPHGLVHKNAGDGKTVAASIGGRDARKNADPNSDFYMYFAAADWFTYQGEHSELSITIEYFDDGTAPLVLQYDSNTGSALEAFYKNGGSVQRGDTDTWKSHVFHLTDAYFGNRQNHGADFRIFGGVGNTFYLDSVIVSMPTIAPAWNVDAHGDWANPTNWAGGVPNAVDATATFGSVITANRFVYANSDVTVGTLNFNSSQAYLLAGLGSLTLQASTGAAQINVLQGAHKINLPLNIASDTELNVPSGSVLIISDPVTVNAGKSLTQNGLGRVFYSSTVTVAAGGSFALMGSGQVGGIALASNANVDVSGSLVVKDADVVTIMAMVKEGRNGGDWSGPGITSSAAANHRDSATALGVADNARLGLSVFGGFSDLAGDEILIKYTYYGDADLGGTVDIDDFRRFLQGYDELTTAASGPAHWTDGDFDYDGAVDLDDFHLLLYGLRTQPNVGVSPELLAALKGFANDEGISIDLSAIPEPGALGLLLLTAPGALRRTARRLRATSVGQR